MSEDTRSQAYWQDLLFSNLPGIQRSDVWWNPTNHQSLRLSKLAISLIEEDQYIKVNLQSKIIPKHFILLERAMPKPYYVKKVDQIYVFDQTIAVMLTLHSGDLDTCLSNLINYG